MKHVVLTLIVLAMGITAAMAQTEFQDHQMTPLTITKADGSTVNLTVEMAISGAAQEKGLMFRTSMAKDTGMLFAFNGEEPRSFWMRNTLIPLDMIFIRKDGKIVNIHANAVPHDETPIFSTGPAAAVLEINGGRAVQLGLNAGDIIHHDFFANKLAHKATMP